MKHGNYLSTTYEVARKLKQLDPDHEDQGGLNTPGEDNCICGISYSRNCPIGDHAGEAIRAQSQKHPTNESPPKEYQ